MNDVTSIKSFAIEEQNYELITVSLENAVGKERRMDQ